MPTPAHLKRAHANVMHVRAQLHVPVKGTEDWKTIGESIWSYAWNVATQGHLPATKFDLHEVGVAIDPPIHRTQHQVRVGFRVWVRGTGVVLAARLFQTAPALAFHLAQTW